MDLARSDFYLPTGESEAYEIRSDSVKNKNMCYETYLLSSLSMIIHKLALNQCQVVDIPSESSKPPRFSTMPPLLKKHLCPQR